MNKEDIQGVGMTSRRTRERLVERLTSRGVSDVRVLMAIRETPRHLFVEEALASRAYEDTHLPIGYRQTISQPLVVALMTQALIRHTPMSVSRPLGRVLEIGTGCGYQTAILARFAEEVCSIERIKPLHNAARQRLRELAIRNVRLRHLDGTLGWPDEPGCFEAILSAAAPPVIPDTLLEQLQPGGRLVIPVGPAGGQHLALVTRTAEDEYQEQDLGAVSFVPLLGGVE